MNNPLRIGNLTSSKNFALMSNGKQRGTVGAPFKTYVAEKNMERRLGRVINTETTAFETSWGKLVEKYVFDILPTDYKLCSQETLQHPEIEYWSGSPDIEHFFEESHLDAIGDIKCPATLKSFCQLVQPIYDGFTGLQYFDAIREGYTDHNGDFHEKHKDGEKFYWQLVSNACITGHKYAELIVFAPYKSELEKIKMSCEGNPDFYNIFYKDDQCLPYLIEGGYYRNLNVARMEVPEEDKVALRTRVLLAGEDLIAAPKLVTA